MVRVAKRDEGGEHLQQVPPGDPHGALTGAFGAPGPDRDLGHVPGLQLPLQGRGLAAGFSIVLIGIMLDRITTYAAQRGEAGKR